jgi:peptidoglycan/xylan/chitin deacetylase (PgdA/CDA1 family)
MSPDRRWILPTLAAMVAIGVACAWVVPGRPLWPVATAGILFAGAVAVGVTWVGSGIFGQVLVSGPKAGDRLALTFDDGPDPQVTREIARLLEARGFHGTFFVVGERAERHRELLRGLVDAGHEVGIHSYDHSPASSFPAMGWLAQDFERATAAVEGAIGRHPRLYRPPVGLLNPRIHRVARRGGWTIVGWTVRARDGVPTSVDAVLRRVLPGLRAGAVVLLHDRLRSGTPASLEALPAILDEMENRGLGAVTLSALTGIDAYRRDPAAGGGSAG